MRQTDPRCRRPCHPPAGAEPKPQKEKPAAAAAAKPKKPAAAKEAKDDREQKGAGLGGRRPLSVAPCLLACLGWPMSALTGSLLVEPSTSPAMRPTPLLPPPPGPKAPKAAYFFFCEAERASVKGALLLSELAACCMRLRLCLRLQPASCRHGSSCQPSSGL